MRIMLISGRRPYNFQNNSLPAGQSKNNLGDNMYTTANKYGRNLVKNNLFGGICNPAGGEQRIFNPLWGCKPRSCRVVACGDRGLLGGIFISPWRARNY